MRLNRGEVHVGPRIVYPRKRKDAGEPNTSRFKPLGESWGKLYGSATKGSLPSRATTRALCRHLIEVGGDMQF